MRGAADVAHGLHDAAVVGAGHARLAVLPPRSPVDHHREVDVVEVTEPQELGFAAEELELARARLAHPPLDIAVLLGRDGKEGHAPGELVERLRVE